MEGTTQYKVTHSCVDVKGSTSGKPLCIITGATGSMGAVATRVKAAEGKCVVMACRNVRKAEELRLQILTEQPKADIVVMPLELSSPSSIREFVQRLVGHDVTELFCNAGIKAHHYTLTEDGIEMDFATNYLGNRLLTNLLVPLMPAGSHIVIMVSLTTKYARLDKNWRDQKSKDFGQLSTYASSKLALMYYAIGLAKRHPELHINVADPGIVDSNMINMGRWYDPLADIFFRPFIKTPEQGVYPALKALKTEKSLCYFVGKKENPIPNRFINNTLVEELWQQ